MNEKIYKLTNNFSKNLKTERLSNNLTQKQMAEKIGIKTQSYQAYEAGLTLPTTENLLKICLILNVSLDYLFDYTLS